MFRFFPRRNDKFFHRWTLCSLLSQQIELINRVIFLNITLGNMINDCRCLHHAFYEHWKLLKSFFTPFRVADVVCAAPAIVSIFMMNDMCAFFLSFEGFVAKYTKYTNTTFAPFFGFWKTYKVVHFQRQNIKFNIFLSKAVCLSGV